MNHFHWNIHHLQTLQVMDQSPSITEAANRLCVTQSALSRRILKLEDLLSVQLFHRIGKRMVMTAAGKRLLTLANHILPLCEQANQDLTDLALSIQPSIRIATECFTCYHWLPTVVKKWQTSTPIEIITEATDDPNQALLDGLIDLSIANQPCDHNQVVTTPLFRDEYLAVTSTNHPWAQLPHVSPEDCADEHFVQYGHKSRAMDAFLKPHNIFPQKTSAVPLTGGIMQLIRAEMGVAFLSEWVLQGQRSGPNWVAKPLGPNGLYRQWHASYLKGNQSTAIQAFSDRLRKAMSRHRD